MELKFSYQLIRGKLFPIIPVTLKYGDQEIRIEALVDAGANFSIFDAKVAKLLGINLEEGDKICPIGIGGHICAYLHDITMTVDNITIQTKVAFSAEFAVSLNIIGRQGFFDKFIVCYDDIDGNLLLRTRDTQ